MVEDLSDIIAAALLAIGLVAGAASIVLAFNAWRRAAQQEKEVRIGTAFDVNLIAPRVQRVRADYVMALHSRPHPRFHPAKLLNACRASLSRFAYFTDWDRRAYDEAPAPGQPVPKTTHG